MPPPKKKSILFIVDKIFPTDEIFVEEIYAKMIPSRGYNVSFVIRKDENILSAPKKWHGNKIFFVSNEMSTSNPIKKIYLYRKGEKSCFQSLLHYFIDNSYI